MTEQKKTRSELKRAAIIEAALRSFKEDGVQGSSMDSIALLANVSKRTVYNHFASKEALVMFLTNKLWQQSIVDIDIAYCSDSSLASQLTELLEAQVQLYSSQQYIDLCRMAFGHFFYHPQALQAEFAKLNAQESALKRWLKAAFHDKRLAIDDIDFALNQLNSLTKGSSFWPQMMGYGTPLNSEQQTLLVKETCNLFLARYKT